MELGRFLCLFLVCLTCFLSATEGSKFYVGGRDGWVLKPSVSYNHWAERNRFLVNDTLYFKYNKGSDSVLVVNKDSFYNCNTSNPIQKLDDGNSEFKFDRSGPFYFISGQDGNCAKGQKLIIIVLAVRHRQTPPAQPPMAAPPQGSAPAPVPSKGSAPAAAPSGPASTPSHAPSTTPITTPVPAPSKGSTPDEAEAVEEEEPEKAAVDSRPTESVSEKTNFWEDLLKDRYEVHKVEEFNALGKGKRSRKQMVSVEEDDLAGLEDVSSDGEDDNYEAEVTDGETASSAPLSGTLSGRKPNKKRSRVDSAEPLPLMEGEGRSFKVLGFNQNQRATFVQILMRFGMGDYDWKEFVARMKKTYEEIKVYGTLFLEHIVEQPLTDSPTFSDGVPKEGLRIQDVLVRISVMSMIHQKAKFATENPGAPLYEDDIMFRYPGLKGSKYWKEYHDGILLHAVLKHGYGRWQAIVDDKDLGIQEVICQELNLPFMNLPVPGQVKAQNTEAPGNAAGNGNGNDVGENVVQGTIDPVNQPQSYQESSTLHHFRDMQRRLVEFIKRRVLLLEKGNNAEAQKEYFDELYANEIAELEKETMGTNLPYTGATDKQMGDQLPRIEEIGSEEILAAACDNDPDRLKLPQLYNEMCKLVEGTAPQSLQTSFETICEDILSRTRPPVQQNPPTSAQPTLNADRQPGDESKSNLVVPESPSAQDNAAEVQMRDLATEPKPETVPETADE